MINWKEAEQALGFNGKTMAKMAGISEAMWSQIKNGHRKFPAAKQVILIARLGAHFNINNTQETLRKASNDLKHIYNSLEKRFPTGEKCDTETLEELVVSPF